MRRNFKSGSGFVVACALLAPSAAIPEAMPVEMPMELSESGSAYLDAISSRRVRSDTAYFDPSAPPPELKVEARLPPPRAEAGDPGQDWTPGRWVTVGIAGGLLLLILWLTARFGGGRVVAWTAEVAGGRRADGTTPDPQQGEATLPGLAEILAMADRRAALPRLFALTLAAVARAHGLRIGRAQTARDIARGLPRDWALRGAFAEFLQIEESVQFGGRDVPEPLFLSCVATARSIVGAAGPAGSGSAA